MIWNSSSCQPVFWSQSYEHGFKLVALGFNKNLWPEKAEGWIRRSDRLQKNWEEIRYSRSERNQLQVFRAITGHSNCWCSRDDLGSSAGTPLTAVLQLWELCLCPALSLLPQSAVFHTWPFLGETADNF